jgi:dTDP-4-amino-4,6-dideoxygalactose transaminase
MKVPQSMPFVGVEEYEAIKQCFETNWITEGPLAKEFSEKLCAMTGAKYGDLSKAFPIADIATTSSFFVGTYAGITKEKMNYIKKVVDSFFNTVVEVN